MSNTNIMSDINASLEDILNSAGIESQHAIQAGEGGQTAFAIALAFLGAFLLLAVVWYILQVVAYWLIFTKAGEAGWKSLIPIYNEYIQYKLTWNTAVFWITAVLKIVGGILLNMDDNIVSGLGALIALAEIVLSIMSLHHLSKAFGHGAGFTVGLVFLNPIFKLILGFSQDPYVGNFE